MVDLAATAGAVGLAAAGYAVGFVALQSAARRLKEQGLSFPAEVAPPRAIMATVPLTPVLFVLVIALLHDGTEVTGRWGILLPMGLAGAVVAAAQGIIFAQGLPSLVQAPGAFGRLLVLGILPETAILFQFIASFLSLDAAANSAAPLMVLGAAAALTAIGQALAASGSALADGLLHDDRFVPVLMRTIVPEVLVLAAFVWMFF